MLKIYGNPMSTCTRKVLMTAGETGTPFEMNVVDFTKGEHKQPAHLKRQPFGRIPAIDDEGFALFESRAICRYINDKAKGNLVPADLQGRAKMEQWISVETSEFSAHAMKFVYEHIFKRPQESAVLEAARAALETTLGVMDTQLASTQFIAGATFSIADISFMPYVEYAVQTPAREFIAKHQPFMAWWKRVSERPTWQKVSAKA